jgi:hypothetical protein
MLCLKTRGMQQKTSEKATSSLQKTNFVLAMKLVVKRFCFDLPILAG